MISIQKSGDTINFTFTDSSHYLYGNGTISVPENSLSLTIDESDIVNFKKADSNDIFISATLGEFGKTKAELIEFYKENMVNAGISSGDVETMISSATSGFADSVSYNSTTKYVEFFNGSTKVFEYDASEFVIDGMVDNVEIKTISSGGTNVDVLAITFNVESGKNEIDIPLSDIFDPDLYYTKTEVDSKLSGKVDTSAFTSYSGSIESRLSEDEEVTSAALNALNETVEGKQNTLTAGSGITISGDVISADGGGGKAIEAGRGITITTGETADTVSFSLPISAGTGTNALVIASDTYKIGNKAQGSYSVCLNGGGFYPNYAKGYNSLAEGMSTKAYGKGCHSEGYGSAAGVENNIEIFFAHAEGDSTEAKGTASHAEGSGTIANNHSEHASGRYNVSSSASTTFGDSGNTLFSVGNGTADNARHNAFEVRQNGDIYCSDGTNDVKLQDYIQHKIIQMSQSEYDALVNKDANTIYLIVN